ncbi:uncharacterized protein LOC135923011 isoform X1 [Gordionus sp. m RMFG-2023]|uniref:uncharacterized protein LOC135923011 isoform X1 n=1 Tax=Gordionus sp. m RMFG-2023 TaxID=3053472 RepID=UPI0031FCE87F
MIDCALDFFPFLSFLPPVCKNDDDLSKTFITLPDHNKIYYKTINNQIYLDCEPLFNVPQNATINFSQIDIILISNYVNMLALPYITEHKGFKGSIYATEPTFHFGRLYMLELVSYFERSSELKLSKLHIYQLATKSIQSKLPDKLKTLFKDFNLYSCYNRENVESCMNKVTCINFLENLNFYNNLTCHATSAGYCIGSCNWVIKSDYEKLVFISKSSILTAHPKPLDLANLKKPDIMILTELTKTPYNKPDTMITEFSKCVISTLKKGGNVLVPCPLSGVTLDLLECLHLSLSTGLKADFAGPPKIYFVCPEVKSSLAYANIFSEWLCTNKQIKVYLPEEPFPHSEMTERGSLHLLTCISQLNFRSPCVVLAGHSSLSRGPAASLLRAWRGDPSNTLIIVDPTFIPTLPSSHQNASKTLASSPNLLNLDFAILENTLLAPFAPLRLQVAYCPIDTGLVPAHVEKLLRECEPTRVICSPIVGEALRLKDGGDPEASKPLYHLDCLGYHNFKALVNGWGTINDDGVDEDSSEIIIHKTERSNGSLRKVEILSSSGGKSRKMENSRKVVDHIILKRDGLDKSTISYTLKSEETRSSKQPSSEKFRNGSTLGAPKNLKPSECSQKNATEEKKSISGDRLSVNESAKKGDSQKHPGSSNNRSNLKLQTTKDSSKRVTIESGLVDDNYSKEISQQKREDNSTTSLKSETKKFVSKRSSIDERINSPNFVDMKSAKMRRVGEEDVYLGPHFSGVLSVRNNRFGLTISSLESYDDEKDVERQLNHAHLNEAVNNHIRSIPNTISCNANENITADDSEKSTSCIEELLLPEHVATILIKKGFNVEHVIDEHKCDAILNDLDAEGEPNLLLNINHGLFHLALQTGKDGLLKSHLITNQSSLSIDEVMSVRRDIMNTIFECQK